MFLLICCRMMQVCHGFLISNDHLDSGGSKGSNVSEVVVFPGLRVSGFQKFHGFRMFQEFQAQEIGNSQKFQRVHEGCVQSLHHVPTNTGNRTLSVGRMAFRRKPKDRNGPIPSDHLKTYVKAFVYLCFLKRLWKWQEGLTKEHIPIAYIIYLLPVRCDIGRDRTGICFFVLFVAATVSQQAGPGVVRPGARLGSERATTPWSVNSSIHVLRPWLLRLLHRLSILEKHISCIPENSFLVYLNNLNRFYIVCILFMSLHIQPFFCIYTSAILPCMHFPRATDPIA